VQLNRSGGAPGQVVRQVDIPFVNKRLKVVAKASSTTRQVGEADQEMVTLNIAMHIADGQHAPVNSACPEPRRALYRIGFCGAVMTSYRDVPCKN
jgi:hypothetical protein